jgi:trans-2,3-dihydro-3-hydroxyanthranilate isomerase
MMEAEMQLEYYVVDVFTAKQLEGNPVAVFVNADQPPADVMQRIAKELNLSETVFVLPPSRPDCKLRARIFTPASEMQFAGHPTIGTAYVARETGLVPRELNEFAIEELIGPVRVRFDDGHDPIVWLDSPPVVKGPVYDAELCAQALGLSDGDVLPDVPCALLTAGNANIFVALRDKETVDRAVLDAARFAALHADQRGPVCMYVFAPTAGGAYSRMFAPELGVREDPATGSAMGPLAVFMMERGLVSSENGSRFVSEQGTALGRRSLLHVHVRGRGGSEGISVGGQVAPVIRATMRLDIR